jgi:hypothetical protein
MRLNSAIRKQYFSPIEKWRRYSRIDEESREQLARILFDYDEANLPVTARVSFGKNEVKYSEKDCVMIS